MRINREETAGTPQNDGSQPERQVYHAGQNTGASQGRQVPFASSRKSRAGSHRAAPSPAAPSHETTDDSRQSTPTQDQKAAAAAREAKIREALSQLTPEQLEKLRQLAAYRAAQAAKAKQATPQSEPQAASEPAPQAAPEPQAQPAPELKEQPAPQPEAAARPQPKPAPKPQPETTVKPKARPIPEPEPEDIPKPEDFPTREPAAPHYEEPSEQPAEPEVPQETLPQSEEPEEEERPKKRFPVGCLVIVILLALVAFGAWKVTQFYGEVDGDRELGESKTITIEQGSTVADITNVLKENGIIEYDWLFKLYAKYSGKANELQYGDFELRSGMPYNDILHELTYQKVKRKTVQITFPEGSTAVAIAQKMEDSGLCSVDDFLACANGDDGSDFSQYRFWTEIPDSPGRLMKCEGYLFPDTYEFYQDDTVYNYVNTFYKEFDAKTSGLWDTINEKGTSMNDVIILASFIQEEAGLPEEDAKVSACFHNRLESTDPEWADHKLESNASSYIMQDSDNNYLWNSPTAEYYGWPEAGAIPEDVLNAYDTYRISGLPAGAISNPGYAAIDAALNPDEEFMAEGYYFFVTGNPNGDYPGQYFYAKTADEHLANCAKAGW